MRTYRIFNTYSIDQTKDIKVFGFEWMAKVIAWFKGPAWDYFTLPEYDRHNGHMTKGYDFH